MGKSRDHCLQDNKSDRRIYTAMQLLKKEKLIIYKITALKRAVLILIVFIQIASVPAICPGMGDGQTLQIGCAGSSWILDSINGSNNASLRSAPIECSGASNLYGYANGPTEIRFNWKKDVPSSIGQLLFLVDGEKVLECPSGSWSEAAYYIPSGNHTITWSFRKIKSFPKWTGAGWVDDIMALLFKSGAIYSENVRDALELDSTTPNQNIYLPSNETIDTKTIPNQNISPGITIYSPNITVAPNITLIPNITILLNAENILNKTNVSSLTSIEGIPKNNESVEEGKLIYAEVDKNGPINITDHIFTTINEALKKVDPNGSTIVIKQGEYDEYLQLDKPVHLIGHDNPLIFNDSKNGDTVIWIKSGNVTIDSISIRGYFKGTDNSIQRKTALSIFGENDTELSNILIRQVSINPDIYDNGKSENAVYIKNCKNITLNSCNLSHAHYSVLKIEECSELKLLLNNISDGYSGICVNSTQNLGCTNFKLLQNKIHSVDYGVLFIKEFQCDLETLHRENPDINHINGNCRKGDFFNSSDVT